MCRTLRHTLLEALRDALTSKSALFGGLLLGLVASSSAHAQQTNGWSPQPFVKPSNAVPSDKQSSVPANSLRPSENTGSSDIVRWGKVAVQPKAESNTRSYSEVFTTNANQGTTPADNRQEIVLRQPTSSTANSNAANMEPRSGFGRSVAQQPDAVKPIINARMQQSSPVRLASHNESVEPTPAPAEKRNVGVWQVKDGGKDAVKTGITLGSANEKGERSNVQKARYQESLLPDALLPKSAPPANDPSNSPPLLNRDSILDKIPNANPSTQSPPSKPNRSLVEPEQIKPNPFSEPKSSRRSESDRSPSDDKEPRAMDSNKDRDPAPPPPIRRDQNGVDCDAVRLLAKEFDITKIAVDSSPSFVKGIPDRRKPGANTKESFVASAESRSWLNIDGQVVAEGKLVDLVRDSVVIEQANGTRTTYLLYELCDADKAYVSEKWGLPVTCAIDDRSFPRRDFVESTVTWKASGACHKPLYFEDVQLERYGHEWGPFAQPVMSTAHFFGDVLVLPYKMGIHPMNECQYSLGHYRPGNCAPWTVGPVPLSLRGALMEAKVITGAALILP